MKEAFWQHGLAVQCRWRGLKPVTSLKNISFSSQESQQQYGIGPVLHQETEETIQQLLHAPAKTVFRVDVSPTPCGHISGGPIREIANGSEKCSLSKGPITSFVASSPRHRNQASHPPPPQSLILGIGAFHPQPPSTAMAPPA